jgi:hypothetical protein
MSCGQSIDFSVLSWVPSEICAGRLAEAEAEALKGAESLVPHLPTGKKDGLPERRSPNKSEREPRIVPNGKTDLKHCEISWAPH